VPQKCHNHPAWSLANSWTVESSLAAYLLSIDTRLEAEKMKVRHLAHLKLSKDLNNSILLLEMSFDGAPPNSNLHMTGK
jgi:hypothetical protein